jgi:hypothetical protein
LAATKEGEKLIYTRNKSKREGGKGTLPSKGAPLPLPIYGMLQPPPSHVVATLAVAIVASSPGFILTTRNMLTYDPPFSSLNCHYF